MAGGGREGKLIAIIDYGAGNLRSVEKAFRYLGEDAAVTDSREALLRADAAVLPGVGAFGDAMASMRASGLEGAVKEFACSGRPFLGICLGLQLLFGGSEESPGVRGLGILPGQICRIPPKEGLKIPHIGWNSLLLQKRDGLFRGLPEEPYVYFVHSYCAFAETRSDVSAQARYGVAFDAAVSRGNLHAVQFHPEKSGETGLEMLRNFAAMI